MVRSQAQASHAPKGPWKFHLSLSDPPFSGRARAYGVTQKPYSERLQSNRHVGPIEAQRIGWDPIRNSGGLNGTSAHAQSPISRLK